MNPCATNPTRSVTNQSAWLALLDNEWQRHRRPVIGLLLTWIIGLWILVLFNHPGFTLAIGLIYVLLFAGQQAGIDIVNGTEEFSFAQPSGRGPLYLARMTPGLVFILTVGILGGLAISFNLPQKIWSLVFSSGLTEPFAPIRSRDRLWYPLSVCIPLAAFSITFALAALARSRALVFGAWLPGIGGAAGIAVGGSLCESMLWQRANGMLSCPLLLACTVLCLLGGYLLYQRKEAVKGSGQPIGGSSAWIWILVGLIILFLFIMFFFVNVSYRKSSSLAREAVQAQEAMSRAERSADEEVEGIPDGHE